MYFNYSPSRQFTKSARKRKRNISARQNQTNRVEHGAISEQGRIGANAKKKVKLHTKIRLFYSSSSMFLVC